MINQYSTPEGDKEIDLELAAYGFRSPAEAAENPNDDYSLGMGVAITLFTFIAIVATFLYHVVPAWQ